MQEREWLLPTGSDHRRPPGMLHESAQALVDEADLTCPYSKATRGNINVAICVTTTPVNLGTADKAA